MSPQEIVEKGSKNLCFYCDEKYTSGHKCKGQMYKIELIMEELEE